MAIYTIREIDDNLWQAAKTRAQTEGRSMRGVLLLLLRLYVSGNLAALEAATRTVGGPVSARRQALGAQP